MKDKITAVVFMLLALFFLIGAFFMPFTTEYGKYGAPGIVPIVFSTIVILLNLVMFLRKREKKVPSQTDQDRQRISAENKRLLISVIICLGYVFLLGHLNFIILTSIFVATLSLIFYRKKPVLIIVVSVLVTYGIYYIFEKLFLLPLP
ncbi:tripartite tricarboxylate transporter TctB family protein [Thermotoga profunda]|uniref:tripartite tricarboxylate transporter TctB family protein n=1 Tax=Thermotoga profunda TaxID=1508420 RepID=UPI000597B996|nr:tripartite tricarboxylate transporter TctB family protein [Thermotoga profunda]